MGGTGAGVVTSSPVGISCPGTCTATFAPGAGSRSRRPGPWSDHAWSGDCTGSDPNGCAVTMDQARTVTATFTDLGPATASIKPPGARNGPVRVRFDEPVHHVNTDNVVLRRAGGARLDARLTCFDEADQRTPCRPAMPSAVLQTDASLRQGSPDVATVDR